MSNQPAAARESGVPDDFGVPHRPLDPSRSKHRDLQRSVVIGALCALFFGSWAFIVNVPHGLLHGLTAALVQACMSFTTSFSMAEGIHALERALGTSPWARVATAFVPGLLADAVIAAAHLCAGTPEILRTMLPGIVIGTVNSCLYVAWRGRARRRSSLDGVARHEPTHNRTEWRLT